LDFFPRYTQHLGLCLYETIHFGIGEQNKKSLIPLQALQGAFGPTGRRQWLPIFLSFFFCEFMCINRMANVEILGMNLLSLKI